MVEKSKGPPQTKSRSKTRLHFEGLDTQDEIPKLKIAVTNRRGSILHEAEVAKDGSFDVPSKILKSAYRVHIGPSDADPDQMDEVALKFHTKTFIRKLEIGTINIAKTLWMPWVSTLRCVSGKVKVCRLPYWWPQDFYYHATLPLKKLAKTDISLTQTMEKSIPLRQTSSLSSFNSLNELLLYPFHCAPVCQGTVEVYRRICCCKPWVVFDPRHSDLLKKLTEIVVRWPKEIPIPPDPGPLAKGGDILLKDGTLDEMAIHAAEDLVALQTMRDSEVPAYINARPHLLCWSYSCGSPTKVAEGTLGPSGQFNICWTQFPVLLLLGCHEEFSYVVKQVIGTSTITIYNGISANRWHHSGDNPTLTSHHSAAIGCRDNIRDPVIYLDLIGDTGAHELITPPILETDGSATSVSTPAANDGLVFPNAATAPNSVTNRNWGGTLKLNFMFGEGCQDAGVEYYQLSISEADSNGDPVGTRYYLTEGLIWNKTLPGGTIVPENLGPNVVGTHTSLYKIPYDANPTTNWNAGQYHAYLKTNSPNWPSPDFTHDPSKRYLLMLEVFDATGKRLIPTDAPDTGLDGPEGTAAFTYRRRNTKTGPTTNVPFGALSHLFWWDNRDVYADIVDLRKDGAEFETECLFFHGTAESNFSVGYIATHPNEKFQHYHKITWKRGLGNTTHSTGVLQPKTYINVGVPTDTPGPSATNTFGDMLKIVNKPSRKKCAFTASLNIWNKRTDGDYTGFNHTGDTVAFVIDISPGQSGGSGP